MPKITVDVVLLPNNNIMDKVIKVNEEIVKQVGDKIVLNKKNCLPHISLAMGCVNKKDFPSIKKILKNITKNFSPINLSIIGIHFGTTSFEVGKTKEIQLLHETVINKLSKYFSYDATLDMVYSPPVPEERTLFWINNYKKFAFNNFFPHITLGVSKINNIKLSELKFPIKFAASKLALCHLGNYCTCKKILFEVKLKH